MSSEFNSQLKSLERIALSEDQSSFEANLLKLTAKQAEAIAQGALNILQNKDIDVSPTDKRLFKIHDDTLKRLAIYRHRIGSVKSILRTAGLTFFRRFVAVLSKYVSS